MKATIRSVLALGLALGLLGQADATPQLRLTSGASTVTVADGDADGIVSYNGAIGGWWMNMTNGFSKPAFGSESLPWLDLFSMNASTSGAAQSLTIMLTDTGFDAISGSILSAIGGTTNGSVSYQAYADASNTAFGLGTLLASIDSTTAPAFSGQSSTAIAMTNPFSLTLLVTINHDGSRPQATSFDASVQVPEPGTLALIGAGLLALGFVVARRRTSFAPAAL